MDSDVGFLFIHFGKDSISYWSWKPNANSSSNWNFSPIERDLREKTITNFIHEIGLKIWISPDSQTISLECLNRFEGRNFSEIKVGEWVMRFTTCWMTIPLQRHSISSTNRKQMTSININKWFFYIARCHTSESTCFCFSDHYKY